MRLSEVLVDNEKFRIDSEYFKKEYIFINQQIEKHNTNKLSLLSKWITQGSNPNFSEYGYNCLTGRNIKSEKVEYENSDFVDENEYQALKRFTLHLNDILITLKGKGSIGKIGFVIDDRKAIFSRDIGLIRIDSNKTNSIFIHMFFLSKFGIKLIERGETYNAPLCQDHF